jgi:glycosyltransferase involved in cell wall biosynthesis
MRPVSKGEVTVVLPTLNEEEAIGQVIDELRGEGYGNILVVDGYSRDRTVEIAGEKGVKVVYQRGVGKAGAVKTAVETVETPYILFMDADHTYSAEDIERLLAHIHDCDEVIGLRMDRHNIPLLHRVGNRVISLAFSLFIGSRLWDPCSGMYLLRTESARMLELSSRGFDVEVEVASQLSTLGRVREVPISYRRRLGGRKLQTWKEGFNIMAKTIRMALLYNPVFLFSSLAASFLVPGASILSWQLYTRYVYGAEKWSLGWAWLGLTLLIVGIQGLALAVTSLLLKRMERRIVQAIAWKSKRRP